MRSSPAAGCDATSQCIASPRHLLYCFKLQLATTMWLVLAKSTCANLKHRIALQPGLPAGNLLERLPQQRLGPSLGACCCSSSQLGAEQLLRCRASPAWQVAAVRQAHEFVSRSSMDRACHPPRMQPQPAGLLMNVHRCCTLIMSASFTSR